MILGIKHIRPKVRNNAQKKNKKENIFHWNVKEIWFLHTDANSYVIYFLLLLF